MYDKIVGQWVTNESQIAYILAMAKLETNRSNQPWFKDIEDDWNWNDLAQKWADYAQLYLSTLIA